MNEISDITDVSTGLVCVTSGDVYDRKQFSKLCHNHMVADKCLRDFIKNMFPLLIRKAYEKTGEHNMLFPTTKLGLGFTCIHYVSDKIKSKTDTLHLWGHRLKSESYVCGAKYVPDLAGTPENLDTQILVRNTSLGMPDEPFDCNNDFVPILIDDVLNTESMVAIMITVEKYFLNDGKEQI